MLPCCCRYFSMKQQLLESFGFAAQDRFPVFADRFPIQLLSYLRLTRIQDPLLFAKVRGKGVMQCLARHRGKQMLDAVPDMRRRDKQRKGCDM